MPPRKKYRGSSSSAPAYDADRFVSLEAMELYTKGLSTRPLIEERGFDFESFDLGANFNARKWGILCGTPV